MHDDVVEVDKIEDSNHQEDDGAGFKSSSIPSTVLKGAPDFCSIYVISKGKVSSVRNASYPAPYTSPLLEHIQNINSKHIHPPASPSKRTMNLRADRTSFKPRSLCDEPVRPPLTKGGRGLNAKAYSDFSESDTEISFISSDRPSIERLSPTVYDFTDSGRTSRLSTSSDQSFQSIHLDANFTDLSFLHDISSFSQGSGRTLCSWSSQNLDDVEAEMRRLKLELKLKQTMDMYSTACKEALTTKQKASELHHWKLTEERKFEEAKHSEEVALAIVEKERARSKIAMETAEAANRIAELESQKRANAEIRALKEAAQAKEVLDNLARRGYGPVYRCYLDHTPVAVKVLRLDAAHRRSQFQQVIDILSCIRHPNMVLLLGTCLEFGILVYEYMANGSLDDCIFQKGHTPPLSWQLRFRIAAEIATGLLFLHETKPEPMVHRDLKPGNILLDHNYVSKISDVGLARLVPAVASWSGGVPIRKDVQHEVKGEPPVT
ncbi:hypothetical protein ACB092_05G294300 [Castanea dentata]